MRQANPDVSCAKAFVAEALGLPAAAVPSDARIGAFEPWDSLGHLRIMLAIEAARGRPLDAAEAVAIESLPDIAAAMAG